ncbi:hypothetical protein GCM10023264_21590 [Sphingomonas daechungensis]|uniref:histidine kinase n=1 Tax=Sphingomonas daechungensis TaxID=1176646 RepID=A0ABX6T1N1_9SPHN|nr:PAS domain S-box protein [Sphingomonas daechungensis]QNP43747.1 PAS domain-containing protein [Sphingomonas daechungensis]
MQLATGTGFYEWYADEDRLVWSEGLQQIYGVDTTPNGEAEYARMIHPDDRLRVEGESIGILGGKERNYSHEFRIVRPDGTVRTVLDRGSVERDDKGRVTVIRGLNVDITDYERSTGHSSSNDESAVQRLAELEVLYAEAPIGLAMFDRDLRFLRINRALAETNGFSVVEHLGRTVWDLVPDLRESGEPALRQVLETGLPLRDVTVRGATAAQPGVTREWREHFYPVRGSDGAVTGVGIICEEVTDRVVTEKALAESEARLIAALHAGRLGVHDFYPASRTMIWDSRVRSIWGVAEDETVTVETFLAGVHSEDRDGLLSAVEAAFNPAGDGRYEAFYRVIHRTTGTVRWVRAAGDVTFEDGAAVRLVGTVQDVSEQVEAERRLRGSQETFQHLVERSPFGIYAVDADFRLVQVSDGAQKVFENVRPLIGQDFEDVLRTIWPENFASEAIALFRHTLASGEPYHSPTTVERRADIDATEAYDWKIERVMMPDGRPGVVCHFYDLSERQAYEEKIEYLMRELNHRAKNMLTLVNAIAYQTAAAGTDDFLDRFGERIRALGSSQDLLVRSESAVADLKSLIATQLLHFKDLVGTRILLEGPKVELSPSAAQTLGMAFHELATNAAKYGALSNDTGRVEVSWSLDDEGGGHAFSMLWRETGGPVVRPPARKGFGDRVARTMVEKSLGCGVRLDYAETGVIWALHCSETAITGNRRESS